MRHGVPSTARTLKTAGIALSAAIVLFAARPTESADDNWFEMKSAHFALMSNASEGATRTLTWQLEQIRGVLAALWPWARVDLNRPLTVLAVKDESSMRAMAPAYWERKNDVRPASVWVSGNDGPYIVLRTDVHADDRSTLNPHLTVYYSYVSLVLQSSAVRPLPPWLSRGLAGVMSNTIVRDAFILLGPPIPWHVQRLRSAGRMTMEEVLATDRSSRVFSSADAMELFDAQAWALVHYLMFGKQGAMRAQFDRLLREVFQGKDAREAEAAALGNVRDLDAAVQAYVEQRLMNYLSLDANVAIKREAFQVTPLPPAQSAATRAALHVALGRSAEARAMIDTARKADPRAPASYVSEGLLFDREQKRDEARQAYLQAVDNGSTNAWAHYRLAALNWKPDADRDALMAIEKRLSRAIELNDRLAPAFAFLGDTRSLLDPKADNALPVARRAVALEPSEPSFHLTAARVLWSLDRRDEARTEAEGALALARTDQEKENAQQMLKSMAQR